VWLVLCASTDLSALWAYQGLRARGLHPLELVSAEQLAHSLRWEHRLRSDGVTVRITLADGREVHHDRVWGVLNRVLSVPPAWCTVATAADREYATQEIGAFFLSWLYALPGPVLNRPTPQGLSGPWRHPSEWHCLAGRAGLSVGPYTQSGLDSPDICGVPATQVDRTVFVAADRVIAPPLTPASVQVGCRRFAELFGASLLGIDFTLAPDGQWIVVGCSPYPDLCVGQAPLLDALAQIFRDGQPRELTKEQIDGISLRNPQRVPAGAGA
jgi:hypothetical protein